MCHGSFTLHSVTGPSLSRCSARLVHSYLTYDAARSLRGVGNSFIIWCSWNGTMGCTISHDEFNLPPTVHQSAPEPIRAYPAPVVSASLVLWGLILSGVHQILNCTEGTSLYVEIHRKESRYSSVNQQNNIKTGKTVLSTIVTFSEHLWLLYGLSTCGWVCGCSTKPSANRCID